jgi:hypothetical protein
MVIKKRNIPIFSFPFLLLFLLGMVLSCGGQQEGAFQTKADSPPVITSVRILPSRPNKESELSLLIQSQNPGRSPMTFRYQWIKNDEEISGENTSTLKSGNFKKGDLIRVKVTPSTGKTDGNLFSSQPVKILNSPPVIQEVWIEPKVARVTDRLTANLKGSDADGDSINYLYKWEKNGIVLPGEESSFLEANRFKKRDSITVTVTPNDGEASGNPKKSEAIVILNSPPTITSSPPTATEGRVYTYHVMADDPDNDPVIFTLKTAPKGMEIDKETGVIRWEVQKRDEGAQLIEIEASDSERAKCFQRFTLTFELK